jgi:hypothetical protein
MPHLCRDTPMGTSLFPSYREKAYADNHFDFLKQKYYEGIKELEMKIEKKEFILEP